MTHTPGPWVATGQDIVSSALLETLGSGRTVRLRIANAKDAGGALSLETVKANAALIAAAPETAAERDRLAATNAELLEALKGIERMFDFGVFTPTDQRVVSKLAMVPATVLGERVRAVIAAIAKAESDQ